MQLIYTKEDIKKLLKLPNFTVTEVSFKSDTLILHLEPNPTVTVVSKDGMPKVQEH